MNVSKNSKNKVLSVFSLVMINVIAVDSIRTLPMAASYGFGLVGLYILATVLYFIPTALITAELSTTWPEAGGLYSWVKRAFGPHWGFLVVYLQWIYNIVWYPTILTLIAGTCAYILSPDLVENRSFMLGLVLIIFWVCTLLNCFGMRLSSWISTFGSLVGTLLPMLFMVLLALKWYLGGNPIQISMSTKEMFPTFNNIQEMVYFSSILFSLLGLEMSSVHALDVQNPAKDYPKALLISVVIITLSLTFASLAIAVVVPAQTLDIVTGIMQAFMVFFNALNMPFMGPWMAGIIVLGGVCAVATWIIGPTKGLFAAAQDGLLPKTLSQTNRFGVPLPMLLLQATLCSILCLVYLLLPTVKSAYWLLSAMAAQLAFLMYALLFITTLRLRYKEKDTPRPYKIPGGLVGCWAVCLFGLAVCLFVIVLGFIPPADIKVGNLWTYESLLIGGELALILPIFKMKKSQKSMAAQPAYS